jgi:hypothetical protein
MADDWRGCPGTSRIFRLIDDGDSKSRPKTSQAFDLRDAALDLGYARA